MKVRKTNERGYSFRQYVSMCSAVFFVSLFCPQGISVLFYFPQSTDVMKKLVCFFSSSQTPSLLPLHISDSPHHIPDPVIHIRHLL